MKELTVIVASENPVKLNAVKDGFQSYFSKTRVEGFLNKELYTFIGD